MTIPLCRPRIGRAEEEAVIEVLRSGHLVQGSRVAAFEEGLARHVGGREMIAVGSGTAALHLALFAAGVRAGDEVLLPDLTWPSPANMVALLGATPVFVDVVEDTCGMDPDALAAALGERTRAVIVVHAFGVPADMIGIRQALAGRPDVLVIEDAACALGASTEEGQCGALADFSCFSFHPRKIVTTGEGGAVSAVESEANARLRRLRNHGLDPLRMGDERFVELGYNLRMSDLHAAIGCVQLDRIETLIGQRRTLWAAYEATLRGAKGVTLLRGLSDPRAVVQSLVVVLADGIDRDRVLDDLSAADIQATLASYSNHRLPPFRSESDMDSGRFPVSTRIAGQGLTLPLYPGMDEDAPAHVGDALRQAIDRQERKG